MRPNGKSTGFRGYQGTTCSPIRHVARHVARGASIAQTDVQVLAAQRGHGRQRCLRHIPEAVAQQGRQMLEVSRSSKMSSEDVKRIWDELR